MNDNNLTIKSDLNLEKNVLNEAIFKVNRELVFSDWYAIEENEIEVKVDTHLGVNKHDPSVGKLVLTVEIFNEDFISLEKPFYCLVEMEFFFKDTIGEYSEGQNVTERFGLNMVSIAYPYVRAYISTLSSISGIDQIHIPTINVYKTFRNDEN
ncbi:hypothetical protein [Enterococcus avium]|uniref:hypothetical protein n=1 Tax=Enterococcus avium TaxID=33945 RepID=UPI001F565497|nr:hypothetical protein [Enterococcus avium]